jgi:hypothetical protein
MKLLITTIILWGSWSAHGQSVIETVNTAYSPWAITAFSLITTEMDQANNGGSLFSYNYIGPNYRINHNERVAFKMAFNANSNGFDRFNGNCIQEQNAAFEDAFIEYNNFNLGLLPGIANIFWSGRVYVPVSQNSRRQKMISRYKSNTIVSRWVTQRLLLEYRNDVSFFHHSQTTFQASFPDDQCAIIDSPSQSNTRMYRLDNWLSFWYQISPRFSVGTSFILRQDAYNRSDVFETSRQRDGRMQELTAFLGPSLRYTFTDNYNVILSVRDRVEYSGFRQDRQSNFSELGQFRAQNTEISLLSFIRF